MALSASNLSAEPRSFSIGPKKIQLMYGSVASGDVSGSITVDGLSRIDQIHVIGLNLTSQASLSGNVATLAFADPAATRHFTVIAIGV